MPVKANLKSRGNSEPALTLSIGELAAATGLSASAIRYYETRGLVSPCERVGGRRRFDEGAVRRLGLIKLCTQAGFSLDECVALLADREGQRTESRDLAARKLGEIDEQIAQLGAARKLIEFGMACQCPTLENCSCSADLERLLRSLDG